MSLPVTESIKDRPRWGDEDGEPIDSKLESMDRDRRQVLDNSQEVLRKNKQYLAQLRMKNKEFKQSLSYLSKEGSTSATYQNTELEKSSQRVHGARRKLDELKHDLRSAQSTKERLMSRLNDIDKESKPLMSEDSAQARKIRVLENKLDKSLIKYNEAMTICKTYEAIVKRLKEERVGFDNQLAAIERTLRAKDHDFQELLSMSHEANHAKELQRQQLAQFRAAYEEERRQKDNDMKERKQYVQARIDQTQRLERKEKALRRAEADALARTEEAQRAALLQPIRGAGGLGPEGAGSEDESFRVGEYEEAVRRIMDALGVTSPHDVVAKFTSQEETHRSLQQMVRDAQSRIDALNGERGDMKARLEELRYSGTGQLGSRRIVDEFESHLSEAAHQTEKQRVTYERLARILLHVRAGVEHINETLGIFKTDLPAASPADASPLDIMRQCEAKAVLLTEAVNDRRPEGTQRGDDPAAVAAAHGHVVLPQHNTRVRLAADEDDVDNDDEDDVEDEDVLDRQTIKKMAALAMQRENRKLRRRTGGARRPGDKD